MTHPLVEFLTARLAEQEALAKTCLLPEHTHPYGDERIPASRPDQWARDLDNYLGGPYGKHTGYWSPTQVLAEIHVKRGLVAEHQPQNGGQWNGGEASNYLCCTMCGHADAAPMNYPCNVLRWLGQPYQDHEDYQGAWAHE
ncbi:hypothetical protein ArV1_065 [Arthrobacter phage vB_ArtM-ArV1]|uniref:Uncharacterized protein n=1 Tax=Arthrobacter phage vB_ArtM-ArV1 TaxID=1566993 RepID=A0A0A7HAY7_9CAUD|nr:hypothetical protein ArV1_065 [Arthrobacter phage vB_ArtM-ArV1]AIZ01753.1 hypothetical protein ArV1_065 [Arthrobacter phage vB_ArtM-ArV1]